MASLTSPGPGGGPSKIPTDPICMCVTASSMCRNEASSGLMVSIRIPPSLALLYGEPATVGRSANVLAPRFTEQRRDLGFHVVVGAAVGPAGRLDRQQTAQVAAVAPRPREDPGDAVGALVERQPPGYSC